MATYIGLDLGGTNIKISVFDDFFHKLGEKRTPTEVRFGSEHVLNRIYDAILALLDEEDDVQNVYHNWDEPDSDEE